MICKECAVSQDSLLIGLIVRPCAYDIKAVFDSDKETNVGSADTSEVMLGSHHVTFEDIPGRRPAVYSI